MDINNTNNVIFDPGGNNIPPAARQARANRARGEAADAELRIEHEEVLRRALEAERIEAEALEQIRREMDNNQLDTEANIRLAAENILRLGI